MARTFVTTTDYMKVLTAAITGPPFTMSIWGYSTSATLEQFAFQVSTNGSGDQTWWLAFNGAVAGDPIRFTARDTAVANASTSTGYSINTWTHACGIETSATSRAAYINGGSKGTNTTSKVLSGFNATNIGMRNNATPNLGFAGRLAEAAIWNVALTDAEVAMLANRISPLVIRPGNLKGYWPILGVGSPEPDYSGNGLNMTITGTLAVADHPPVAPFVPNVRGWKGAFLAAAASSVRPPSPKIISTAVHHAANW